VSNLFGVEMGTPESAAIYMNILYSFGVPSNINHQGHNSPTVNVDHNEEEIQAPRCGGRTRRPPPCGTSQRLGHK
jgi:hypothetical protein